MVLLICQETRRNLKKQNDNENTTIVAIYSPLTCPNAECRVICGRQSAASFRCTNWHGRHTEYNSRLMVSEQQQTLYCQGPLDSPRQPISIHIQDIGFTQINACDLRSFNIAATQKGLVYTKYNIYRQSTIDTF